MPNIKTYDSPALDIRPTEVGVESTAAVGRRAGAFFNQVGAALGGAVRDAGDAYVAYEDHRQISAGAKVASELMAQKEQEWNSLLKDPNFDPNDPSAAAKFREEQLEPALDKFREGFTTQKSQQFAEHFAEQFRNHMVHKTTADMSTAAGIAVHTNAQRTANNLASAVNRDPSSLDFAIRTFDSSLDAVVGSSPNLSATDAARVKAEFGLKAKRGIVQSAVMGMIEKNPGVDLDAIQQKYGEYIDGPELQRFQKAAKAQSKADLLTQKQLEDYHLKTQIREGNNALSKVFTDNVTFDADGKPTVKPEIFKQIMEVAGKRTDKNGNPISEVTDHARAQINWAERQLQTKRETIITDKAVQAQLYTGLFETENPTTRVDILKADAQGKLDPHARATLLSLHEELEQKPLKGPIYSGVMTAVKGTLGDSEKGHENYAKFLQTFIPQYLKESKAGTLPPNALDLRDPESLISKSLAPWRLTAQEKMMGRIEKNNPGAFGLDINGDPFAPPGSATKPTTPRVSNKAEFDALPKGTNYIGADGRPYRKP